MKNHCPSHLYKIRGNKMIGIIYNDLGVFSIIEKLINNYNTNIYLYNNEVKDINPLIEELINKNCKIIITNNNIDNMKDKYKDIYFISLNTYDTDKYILDNKELINSIEKGEYDKVMSILKELDINNKEIVIFNPIYLFIRSILENDFNCKIEDSIDLLINSINDIIKNNNIELEGTGSCYVIG